MTDSLNGLQEPAGGSGLADRELTAGVQGKVAGYGEVRVGNERTACALLAEAEVLKLDRDHDWVVVVDLNGIDFVPTDPRRLEHVLTVFEPSRRPEILSPVRIVVARASPHVDCRRIEVGGPFSGREDDRLPHTASRSRIGRTVRQSVALQDSPPASSTPAGGRWDLTVRVHAV